MGSKNDLLKLIEETQSFLLQGEWLQKGEDFFQALAKYLAGTLEVHYVCIDKFLADRQAQTVAVYYNGQFEDNSTYKLEDTPCGKVSGYDVCFFISGVRQLFPKDAILHDIGAESYAGITLWGTDGDPIGLIAVISRKPLEDTLKMELVLKQVSIRASTELEHRKFKEQLQEGEFFFRESQSAAKIGSYKANILTSCWESSEVMDQIFGIGPGYIKSIQGWLELIHPDERPSMEQYLNGLFHDHASEFDKEYRIIRRYDGETRWIHGIGRIEYDHAGRIFSMTGTVRDITERKKAEDQLRYHANLVETISEAIISTDATFRISSWNKAAEKMYGWKKEEVAGRRIDEILGTDYPPGITRDLATKDLFLSGNWSNEVIQKKKDGSNIHVAASVTIMYDNKDGVQGIVAINRDITRRKQAEEELRKSNERLNLAQEASKSGTWDWNIETNEYYWSKEFLSLFGLMEDSVRSFETWIALVHPDDRDSAVRNIMQSIEDRTDLVNDYRIFRPDGKTIWIRATGKTIYKEGKPLRMLGLCMDVSEQKQAETTRQALEKDFKAIFENNSSAIALLESDSGISMVNDAFCQMCGYSKEELIGSDWMKLIAPEDLERMKAYNQSRFLDQANAPAKYEFKFIRKDGELRIGLISVAVMENPKRLIGSCIDITESKRAEELLFKSQAMLEEIVKQRTSQLEQINNLLINEIQERKNTEKILLESQAYLRALLQRMDSVAEDERIRIAREIHDELGHILTALKFDTEDLSGNPRLPVALKDQFSGLLELINSLIESVQKISAELRPGILDHLGLFPAIEWHARQFQKRTRICCKVQLPEVDIDFNKAETTILFRIIQEILTNITRHAKATHVEIEHKIENDIFTLKVKDNGIGFDVNQDKAFNSFGLMGMKERALSIGGEIFIDSKKNEGTTITFVQKRK
jgi:PAS domain S-box-containing protein